MAAGASHWRPLATGLALLATIWSVGIALTGGFDLRLAGLRFASRDAVDAAILALAALAVAAVLEEDGRRHAVRHSVSLVAALGIGLLINRWMSAPPLWLDEQMIALNVRDRSVTELTERLWLEQSAPAGWLVLQRIALVTFGTSETAVRLVPTAFGAAAFAAAAWIGWRWMTPFGGAIFVLLCSFAQWTSFYAAELKHYSADMFFSLLLPAMTMWALEARTPDQFVRRTIFWTFAAGLAHWFSMGGLLVLPACGIVLAGFALRSHGFRILPALAIAAFAVMLSFAAHYRLTLHYARESPYLRDYWVFGFPPVSASLAATASWFAGQLKPFAMKPGGTSLWIPFWVCAGIGLLLAKRRELGALAGLIALSGFLFTAIGVVPWYERLSLWFLLSLYLGLALFADEAVLLARTRSRHSLRWLRFAAACVIGAVVISLCSDVLDERLDEIRLFRPATTNRDIDDRDGVRWVRSHQQPNDALLTTRLGLPAVWWYGNLRVSDVRGTFTVDYDSSKRDCEASLRDALGGHARLIVYLGFPDMPDGFPHLLLPQLGALGAVTAVQHFGKLSRAAIIDLQSAPAHEHRWDDTPDTIALNGGCATLQAAAPW